MPPRSQRRISGSLRSGGAREAETSRFPLSRRAAEPQGEGTGVRGFSAPPGALQIVLRLPAEHPVRLRVVVDALRHVRADVEDLVAAFQRLGFDGAAEG